MGVLRAEPTDVIASVPQLMAVAHAMEEEAAGRYAELAAHMAGIGNAATAAVFERLAAEERGHVEAVAHWSQERIGKAPDPADVRWEDWPTVFEAEDMGGSRTLTPYRALSVAVRNEERAFAFWSYVSAHTADAAVRREAERMALEELRHVALLRQERRRAYHAERRPARPPAAPAGAFAAEAAAVESALAGLHDVVARALARSGHPASATLARIAAEEAASADALAAEAGAPPVGASGPDLPDGPPEALLDIALERLEAAVDRYFAIADEVQDERALALAQRLAQAAILRLASIREHG